MTASYLAQYQGNYLMALKAIKKDINQHASEILDERIARRLTRKQQELYEYIENNHAYEKRQNYIDWRIESDILFFSPFYSRDKKDMQ